MKHFPRKTAICFLAEKNPTTNPQKNPQNKKCMDGMGISSFFMEPLSVSLWICEDGPVFTSDVSTFSPEKQFRTSAFQINFIYCD